MPNALHVETIGCLFIGFLDYLIQKGILDISDNHLSKHAKSISDVTMNELPALMAAVPMANPTKVDTLTLREKEIAGLLAQGLSHKMIASELYISIHTVHNHIKNLYAKLQVHSISEFHALYSRIKLPVVTLFTYLGFQQFLV